MRVLQCVCGVDNGWKHVHQRPTAVPLRTSRIATGAPQPASAELAPLVNPRSIGGDTDEDVRVSGFERTEVL
jgi:hypothetical protein